MAFLSHFNNTPTALQILVSVRCGSTRSRFWCPWYCSQFDLRQKERKSCFLNSLFLFCHNSCSFCAEWMIRECGDPACNERSYSWRSADRCCAVQLLLTLLYHVPRFIVYLGPVLSDIFCSIKCKRKSVRECTVQFGMWPRNWSIATGWCVNWKCICADGLRLVVKACAGRGGNLPYIQNWGYVWIGLHVEHANVHSIGSGQLAVDTGSSLQRSCGFVAPGALCSAPSLCNAILCILR